MPRVSELQIHGIHTYEYIGGPWRVPRRVPCLELVSRVLCECGRLIWRWNVDGGCVLLIWDRTKDRGLRPALRVEHEADIDQTRIIGVLTCSHLEVPVGPR